jgi:hypothetical protein
MPDMTVPVGAKQVIIEARIVRAAPECASVCYEAGAGRPPCGAGTDVPCRRSRQVEDLGAVAYWHENPARVLAWRAAQALRPVRVRWRELTDGRLGRWRRG